MTYREPARQTITVRKTFDGNIQRQTREHYLRTDIHCGSDICRNCLSYSYSQVRLEARANEGWCAKFPVAHYILPTAEVLINQMAFFEHPEVTNVLILSTVADEVERLNIPSFERLKALFNNKSKKISCFANEFHRDTYVDRMAKESKDERTFRAIAVASKWYSTHLQGYHRTAAPSVLILANCEKELESMKKYEVLALTVFDYVASVRASEPLSDLLKKPSADKAEDSVFHYPPHQKLSVIQAGLKAGKYVQGKFFASRENYLEATVMVEGYEKPVLLQGHENLNRAFNDDIVAVEIFSSEKWSAPSNLVLEEEPDVDVTEGDGEEDDIAGEDATKKLQDKMEKKLKSDEQKSEKQPTGRIIGIVKRNWRTYCGVLKPKTSKTTTRYIFVPADRRIPFVRIESQQGDVLQGNRIVVAIDEWPRTSKLPIGHYVKRLGEVGDKAAENEVLLLEHDVQHDKFSDAVLACLPAMPWTLTEEEVRKRSDLRHLDICSVDPPGCTDIDDALHCRILPSGNVEVGVHIADVTHFVRPNNAMDKEAASRGTTVYLVDQRIDMLPNLLSGNLCSLRGGEERLAFSVLWEMKPTAEIVSIYFTKSVIRSRAALTYAEAQMRIDDKSLNDPVTVGLRGLNNLSKILRAQRKANGALFLASPEVRFNIDSETHDPIDVQTKELKETNFMVEEFMLLANISVAQKIFKEFPEYSLLRRHPAPPVSNYDPVIKAAQSKHLNLLARDGKSLSDSLETAYIPGQPYFNTMLRILTTRCMMQAVYFCSGTVEYQDFLHYGLATPIYTHFTSPIRRYADVMVHRFLAAAIQKDTTYPELLDKKVIEQVCQNINYRHRMAQHAGRASVALHTQLFFRNRKVDEEAYILFVRKNAFQVLIPKYGLEGTIMLADKDGNSIFKFNQEEQTQTFGNLIFRTFDRLVVQISVDQSSLQHHKVVVKLVEPKIKDFSVPASIEEAPEGAPPKMRKVADV